MKRHITKALVWILVLTMTAACFCMQSFAATKETVQQYGQEGGYLAIGDSISRGCGAEGFYLDEDGSYMPDGEGQYARYELRNVLGCVPYQIAQAVGCVAPDDITDQSATYWPFTYPGMTTAVTLDLLGIDDGFTDTKLNYAYYDSMLEYFGYEGSIDGVREGHTIDAVTASKGGIGKCGNIIELIQRADLITVQLGMCDIFYRAYRIISNGGMLADGLQFDLSSPEAILNLVKTAISEMKNGYDYWKENYPLVIEKILELNPDATIVMVGAFNLVNELTITDEMLLPIGDIITNITAEMNKNFRQWEKEYGVIYADISNTETLATESGWSLLGDFKENSFTGTHPSQKGYDYIVRQILAKLPPEGTDLDNIVVDLGRFDKVDYVLVDGFPVTNYSMDGFVITVPNPQHTATNLTIAVKGEDGKIAVQTYQLTYKEGQGFTASRIAGDNDVVGTLKKPWNNLINLLRKLFQKIADLFKKVFNKA